MISYVSPKKRFLGEPEKTNFKTYGYTVNKPLLLVVVVVLLRHLVIAPVCNTKKLHIYNLWIYCE